MIIFPFKTLNRSKQRKIDMAIKIVIKRQFKENAAQKAFELLSNFRREAMGRPGYISGETVEDWIHWEESDQRAANEAKLKGLLKTPVKFEIYDLGVFPTK